MLLPAFKGSTLDYTSNPRVKEEYLKDEEVINKVKTFNKSFSLNSNVCLKDILISNSTGKEGRDKNEWR